MHREMDMAIEGCNVYYLITATAVAPEVESTNQHCEDDMGKRADGGTLGSMASDTVSDGPMSGRSNYDTQTRHTEAVAQDMRRVGPLQMGNGLLIRPDTKMSLLRPTWWCKVGFSYQRRRLNVCRRHSCVVAGPKSHCLVLWTFISTLG
jgi:hypothetical protein